MAAAGRVGLPRSLRTLESFTVQELAPGYNLAQWRNDQQVDRDIRQLFRQYATKSPLLDGVLESVIERAGGCEATVEGCAGEGLLVAYLLDWIAISLPSDAVWDTARLSITFAEMTDGGGIDQIQDVLQHASTPQHISLHEPQLEAYRRTIARTGRELVEQIEHLLPRLRFCGHVIQALQDMGPNDPRFTWVRHCLFELNERCGHWVDGGFPHEGLRGCPSPESQAVANNQELRRLRVFRCPDGQERYFEWHLKHIGLNLRLHYFPEERERVVLVGYVGRHLPTALY
jgi:hypothetical protein